MMFSKENRFMTRKIADSLEFGIQVLLWEMIEQLKVDKIKQDYLQVFEIKGTGDGCTIKHSQEVPSYTRTYEFKKVRVQAELEMKIFVIDAGEYSTMLFAEEY